MRFSYLYYPVNLLTGFFLSSFLLFGWFLALNGYCCRILITENSMNLFLFLESEPSPTPMLQSCSGLQIHWKVCYLAFLSWGEGRKFNTIDRFLLCACRILCKSAFQISCFVSRFLLFADVSEVCVQERNSSRGFWSISLRGWSFLTISIPEMLFLVYFPEIWKLPASHYLNFDLSFSSDHWITYPKRG